MIEQLIKHQMQPCPVSCVSTCLAMIKNVPAVEVIEKWHEKYREGNTSMRLILEDLGIPFTSFDTCENACLIEEGVYLVTAPSLNIVAGTHQILIEINGEDYFVIDPVRGREDRKFYVKRGEAENDPLAVELGSFMLDAHISREWLLERRP